MLRTISILAFCLFTISSIAQTTFIKHYGASSGEGNSLILNSSGNYIIAGKKRQNPPNSDQFCTYELNIQGDTLWHKHYGTDSLLEEANQIIQTLDGGYLSVGLSLGLWPNIYQKIYLVKTTNTGTVSWTRSIAGDNATAIVQAFSGEYFIGGTSNYDYYIVKTDINGDTLWTKKYGGSQKEELNSMRQTSDGGFILSGYSESFSFGSKDFYLVKTNAIGDTLWTKHYGGSLVEISKSVRQTTDGGYIMTGSSESFGISNENMYVVKTNSIGDTIWTKTFGQVGRYSLGNDIIETTDGGYAITGLIRTTTQNSGYDLYLVKIDNLGNVLWEKEFKVEPTNTNFTCSAGRSISQTSDGGFAISGTYFSGSWELLFIKTENTGIVGLSDLQSNPEFTIFPNPFNQSTTLQFEHLPNEKYTLNLYNIEGQLVHTITNILSNKVEIPRNNLKKGIYFLQLRTESEMGVKAKVFVE